MQKVIIDTNVMVSALIQRSYPYYIIYYLFIDNKFQLCISDAILKEYYAVLSRPKFARFPDFFTLAERLLMDIEYKAKKYEPVAEVTLIADPTDNMFLELADICQADFIITGNSTDFTFPKFQDTIIISPKEYWELYRPD